ncbi:MAG: LUD domain-containing protein [Bacteroidota bacterium]
MGRIKILENIKRNKPAVVGLPEIPGFNREEKVVGLFIKNASVSGTRCFSDGQSLNEIIQRDFTTAKNIFAPDFPEIGHLSVTEKTDIGILKNIDLAIFRSPLGVAENGAIWLTEEISHHRIVPFITQHLLVVLSPENIVPTMHEAYENLPVAETGFGVFVAGPSKTADIEQSLVVGAQGARSLGILITT